MITKGNVHTSGMETEEVEVGINVDLVSAAKRVVTLYGSAKSP